MICVHVRVCIVYFVSCVIQSDSVDVEIAQESTADDMLVDQLMQQTSTAGGATAVEVVKVETTSVDVVKMKMEGEMLLTTERVRGNEQVSVEESDLVVEVAEEPTKTGVGARIKQFFSSKSKPTPNDQKQPQPATSQDDGSSARSQSEERKPKNESRKQSPQKGVPRHTAERANQRAAGQKMRDEMMIMATPSPNNKNASKKQTSVKPQQVPSSSRDPHEEKKQVMSELLSRFSPPLQQQPQTQQAQLPQQRKHDVTVTRAKRAPAPVEQPAAVSPKKPSTPPVQEREGRSRQVRVKQEKRAPARTRAEAPAVERQVSS